MFKKKWWRTSVLMKRRIKKTASQLGLGKHERSRTSFFSLLSNHPQTKLDSPPTGISNLTHSRAVVRKKNRSEKTMHRVANYTGEDTRANNDKRSPHRIQEHPRSNQRQQR